MTTFIKDEVPEITRESYCHKSRPLRADPYLAKVILQSWHSNLFNAAASLPTIIIVYVYIIISNIANTLYMYQQSESAPNLEYCN